MFGRIIMSTNPERPRNAVVVSASSGIGHALCKRWASYGVKLAGTYRSRASAVDELERDGIGMVQCDIADKTAVTFAASELARIISEWDALVVCPGDLTPVGPFAEVDFDDWERSIFVNFTAQLRFLRALLPHRRRGGGLEPIVLFFAGGGTYGAPTNYSAYTVSKIALIKMCELLDAEIPDVRFAIIGPGWVRTKIHEQTLAAGLKAGSNYLRTVERLKGSDFVPMEKVLDCCDWVVAAPREVVSGRNFSAANDDWSGSSLSRRLAQDPDMFKLRRAGNGLASGVKR